MRRKITMNNSIIVIGAGAAGLMSAGIAASQGKKVIIVERNALPGKKLLITGKGRCNITNTADIEDIIKNIPGNGNFMYSALYTFNNNDIISFFENNGLLTKTERGGRVFPASDNAKDVVDVLYHFCLTHGVQFRYQTRVKQIITDQQKRVLGIKTEEGQELSCDSVIVCTGGASYKGTGSTGDGYKMARELGHSVIEPRPSLIPLIAEESWVKELQGLSLKNVEVAFFDNNKRKVYSEFGEMLFTHFGVSGPIILSASRHLLKYNYNNVILKLDLKPALSIEALDLRIQRDFEKYSKKIFKNALNDLMPQKLIPIIIMLSGIEDEKPVNQITKQERHRLVNLLKGMEVNIIGARPINEAIITAGGVSVKEIDPYTMESKLVKGLFFAGEIMDVDGYTGGYNLTIAFSTAYVAGTSC